MHTKFDPKIFADFSFAQWKNNVSFEEAFKMFVKHEFFIINQCLVARIGGNPVLWSLDFFLLGKVFVKDFGQGDCDNYFKVQSYVSVGLPTKDSEFADPFQSYPRTFVMLFHDGFKEKHLNHLTQFITIPD